MVERLIETKQVPYVLTMTEYDILSEKMNDGQTRMAYIQDLLRAGNPKIITFAKRYEGIIEVDEKRVSMKSELVDVTWPYILCEHVLFTKLDRNTLQELERDRHEFPEELNMNYHISALIESPVVTSTARDILAYRSLYTLYQCHLYELTKEQVIDHGLKDYFELDYANHKT